MTSCSTVTTIWVEKQSDDSDCGRIAMTSKVVHAASGEGVRSLTLWVLKSCCCCQVMVPFAIFIGEGMVALSAVSCGSTGEVGSVSRGQ